MPTIVPKDSDPEVLGDDMTVADIVEVLQRLPFARPTARGRPSGPTRRSSDLPNALCDCILGTGRDKRPNLFDGDAL
jgi:hypothetical protein